MSAAGKDSARPPAALPATLEQLERLLAEARQAERAGRPTEALARLEGAPTGLRRFGLYHYAVGALRARSGELDAAVDAFERAVAIEPEMPEYRGNLGAALLQGAYRIDGGPVVTDGERLQRALHTLTAASDAGPKRPEVDANLALALLLLQRPADALAACDRALALAPDHAPALHHRALALHALGRRRECLAALERCLAADPGFSPARRSLEHLRGGR